LYATCIYAPTGKRIKNEAKRKVEGKDDERTQIQTGREEYSGQLGMTKKH